MDYPDELDLKDIVRLDVDSRYGRMYLIDTEGRSYKIDENLLAKTLKHGLRKLRATLKRTRYHLSEY